MKGKSVAHGSKKERKKKKTEYLHHICRRSVCSECTVDVWHPWTEYV
jgi:hypothetical protein